MSISTLLLCTVLLLIPIIIKGKDDKKLPSLPCIRDFSDECKDTIPTEFYNKNNILPIAKTKPDIIISQKKFKTLYLDGTDSYDEDNGPEPLTYHWKSYFSPFDLSSVAYNQSIIEIPLNQIYPPDVYTFILYVSDGMAISWAFYNVTVTM